MYAQPKRYEPASLIPLLRVKVLCGAARAACELQRVWEFFRSPEFEALKRSES